MSKLHAFGTCAVIITFLISGVYGSHAEPQNAAPGKYVFPTAHDPRSNYKIDYEDLNDFLSQVLFPVGPSLHKAAPRVREITGGTFDDLRGNVDFNQTVFASRLRAGSHSPSRLEGNRVTYSQLTDGHIEYIRLIKERLESIPDYVDLEKLSKDSQLAYWLNLHNAMVIYTIAEAYPIKDIEPFFEGGKRCVLFRGCKQIDPVLKSAELTLKGQTTTLEDIRSHIFRNWDDPLVIYGFYLGYIGGPNLRASAYKGSDVWSKLDGNAREFINSIRGTYLRGNTLRISEYYTQAERYFPDFDNDIRAHLNQYGYAKVRSWLTRFPKIKASLHNWNVTDVVNGQPTNQRLLIDFQNNIRIKLREVRTRSTRGTNVEIEEVAPGSSNEQNSKESNDAKAKEKATPPADGPDGEDGS